LISGLGKVSIVTDLETEDQIDFTVDHAQIDNMVSTENPVLFCPKKLLLKIAEEEKGEKEKRKEEKKNKEDEEVYTPFIQASK